MRLFGKVNTPIV